MNIFGERFFFEFYLRLNMMIDRKEFSYIVKLMLVVLNEETFDLNYNQQYSNEYSEKNK